ncbi:monothiol glutaredoxin-S7, chloroplastic [Cynara cardunculus var. scolymus]|uniref:monothiol glutaredoxin-S7, chloroplastic n=1 Tax=Cynara cardunculus var. scolymus TaxID=59895 RepID=UPI000D62FD50|nr:monothiol glutaredoxin-S7, chloroplastic [Cynara cardunculus var. scolymus]
MSSSMVVYSRLASSSRIPSFEFVSGPTAINRSSVRYHCRSHTFGSLRFGCDAIKIGASSRRIRSTGCFAALNPELKTTLDKVVTSHKVILFMKGTKDFPQCGFSNTVVQILRTVNVPFETINILDNEMLRQGLKEYSQWPTFPQLYIDGEFFGGCDIAVDAYKSGELQELLEKTLCS